MGASNREEIWEEIERAESYLVSSMYEEASSLASRIISKSIGEDEEEELLECGGMVLLQSLHNLEGSKQILSLLAQSFSSSIQLIPEQVLITGASLQMSSSPSATAEFVGDYLKRRSNGSDDYVAVAELYVINILATALSDIDRAISWLNSAQLPQHAKEGLLQRLQSLPKAMPAAEEKQAVVRLSKRVEPCFWWYRTINFNFGTTQVAMSNGKLALGCLALLLCWTLRRKQVSLRGMVKRQALNMKKAAVELWQLAFSQQLSPLAAVQSPVRASHR